MSIEDKKTKILQNLNLETDKKIFVFDDIQ